MTILFYFKRNKVCMAFKFWKNNCWFKVYLILCLYFLKMYLFLRNICIKAFKVLVLFSYFFLMKGKSHLHFSIFLLVKFLSVNFISSLALPIRLPTNYIQNVKSLNFFFFVEFLLSFKYKDLKVKTLKVIFKIFLVYNANW